MTQSTQPIRSTRQPKPRPTKGYRNQPSTRCTMKVTGNDLNAARHKAVQFINDAFVSCGKLDPDPGRRPRIARVYQHWDEGRKAHQAIAEVTWRGRF